MSRFLAHLLQAVGQLCPWATAYGGRQEPQKRGCSLGEALARGRQRHPL